MKPQPKHPSRPWKNWLLALVLLVAGSIIWVQRNSLSALERETEELERLRRDNQELQRLRAENREVLRLRADNLELHRLRGELATLRMQNRGLESRRPQDQRASTRRNAGADTPQPGVREENYLAKESWTDAGFTTPADTVETMFWAYREANFERLLETMSETDAQEFADLFQSEADVESFWEDAGKSPAGRIPGFHVLSVKFLAEDHAVVAIVGQLPGRSGETSEFQAEEFYLTKSGDEWKIDQSSKPSAADK